VNSKLVKSESPSRCASARPVSRRRPREAVLVDPMSDEDIVIDLDLFKPCSPSQPYRGYQIATGPYHHYYLAAIFLRGRCEAIEGPAANGATALHMAKQRIDSMLPARNGTDRHSSAVALRALQKLDAVARGPDAAMRCDSQEDRLMICASTKALCDEIGIHIRWLSRAAARKDGDHA